MQVTNFNVFRRLGGYKCEDVEIFDEGPSIKGVLLTNRRNKEEHFVVFPVDGHIFQFATDDAENIKVQKSEDYID